MSRKKLIKIALIFCALSCSNLILAQDEQEQNNQQDQPDRYEKFQHSKFGKEIRGRNVFTAAIGTVVPNGDFMNPIKLYGSDSSGLDTSLTLTYSKLDSILIYLNIINGQSKSLFWTVMSTNGTDTSYAVKPFEIIKKFL